MVKLIAWLFWVGSFIAVVLVAIFYFTRNAKTHHEAVGAARQVEQKLEAARQKTLQDLENFLDSQEREEKPGGQAGPSEIESRELKVRKVDEEYEVEALDLEKFLKEEADTFRKDEGVLAEGSTDLHQEVMWRVVGDWVYFRITFSPYDEATHALMKKPEEAVFLSFNDAAGERVAPVSASARIPMSSLYVRWDDDEKIGWAFNGKLSLAKVDPAALDHSRVGWIFSQELHAHLKNLKELRAQNGRVGSRRISQR